ncbi:hypothetical protein D3C76_1003420 [compost metagenome]
MQAYALADLFADTHQRVKMTAGILKNHPQPPTPYAPHVGFIQRQQVLTGKAHGLALDPQV